MDAQELLAPDTGAPLGRSRARVLGLLRQARAPLGTREVAGRCELHPSTARFHLDALVDAGLATRTPQPRTAPGRPSIASRRSAAARPGSAATACSPRCSAA
jgi:predicted ArsR family transcriptional regulator